MCDLRCEPGYTRPPALTTALALAVCLIAGLLVPGRALAYDYGMFIEVETEEDLLDLLAADEIDDDQYETLVELLADGVDLNTADREDLYALPNLTYADVDAILAYRDQAGSIDDPLALVAAGALSERKLVAIAPFLIVTSGEPALFATRGRLLYKTTYVAGDQETPPMTLEGSLSTLRNLDLGLIGVVTRNRISDVVYDPNRDALSARAPRLEFALPKFYLQWETRTFHAVAGTYRIGFGQRLTFDDTTRDTPNGITPDRTINYSQDLARACKESDAGEGAEPCLGQEADGYEAPDYRWTDRLRGAAVGLRHLELGPGWLQAYGWFSYQTRSIYQYEIYDRRTCDDPTSDEEGCGAPWVYRRRADLLAPTSRFSYQSLPDMYNEMLGGANFSYFLDRRTHIGLTGYGADVSWLVEGMDLDFQEWSRTPYGGPFGAVGVDAAWGAGLLDLGLEVARSFDSQPAGGGFAAIARATLTWKHHELELAGRYYDRDYANPYARPISAADEYDGLRARDEAGLRVRYHGRFDDLALRATVDFWDQMSDEAPKTLIKLRADYEVAPWLTPGLWFQFQDKDLTRAGHDEMCFEVSNEEDEFGEPVPCAGAKLQAGAQLRFEPLPGLRLTAKYQHKWLDDRWMVTDDEGTPSDVFGDGFRQDMSGWLIILYKPVPALRLRARLRYLFEDVEHDDRLEQSVWAYLEAGYWFERSFRLKLRYEVYALVGAHSSNPDHWLRLEAEARF